MDLNNLNSLKVADLKQALKSKGLSTVGNKGELIQRLEEALLREVSADVKEIDEEAILGGDDESTISKTDESLLNSADLLLGDTSNLLTSPTASQPPVSICSSESSVAMTTTSDPPAAKSTGGATRALAFSPTAAPSITKLTGNKPILTAEQRKQLRMVKFADPKVLVRAERFGVQPKEMATTESERILQRAQRFGEVVSSKAKTLDEKERLDRRKDRFGTVPTTTTLKARTPITASTNQLANPAQKDTISKRQERFGVVAPEPTANGNKRRRFAY